jgi:predicted DNA-binding transcriptional regulator AlpA
MDKAEYGVPVERLLNEQEVAGLLGLSVATMRRWRLIRNGPKWIKLPGSSAVRYRPEDIRSYVDSRATHAEAC